MQVGQWGCRWDNGGAGGTVGVQVGQWGCRWDSGGAATHEFTGQVASRTEEGS